jgi:hypothetical protein
MAITVNKGTAVLTTGSLSASITTSSVTQHNTLILIFSHEDSGSSNPTFTASDAQGSYTLDKFVARGNQVGTGIFSLWDASSGVHTITITAGSGVAANSGFAINYLEASGLGTVNSFDTFSTNSANPGTTPTTGSTSTLAQASELVIASVAYNLNNVGGTYPPTGGNDGPFISIYNKMNFGVPGGGGDADYQINTSATTAVAAAWGTVTSCLWCAQIGTYKGAGAANFRKTLSGIGGKVGQRQMEG